MKIEVVRKIDADTTIIVNELAKKETIVEKTEAVMVMLEQLTERLQKK